MRRYRDYPSNVPRKLIRMYRQTGENGLKLAKLLGVNDAHLSKLFNKGIEPKDQSIRDKLFLKKIKVKRQKRIYQPRPEWMSEWLHLPAEERHIVIRKYLSWKKAKNKL
jgi:hypothetical protein